MKAPKELKPGATAQRDFLIDVKRAIDEDARTVEIAFSSEAPYERYWGVEVLDHKPSSIRLDRLKAGGALLADHDHRDQIGVIESVQIGKDRVGRAMVRFGRSARASEIFQDVIDGIRRHVSVGYRIHEAKLESERDGVGTYRVTDWEPFEVSLVSVPADASVGVGRSDEPAPASEEIATVSKTTEQPTVEVVQDNSRAVEAATRNGTEGERKRVADIVAIGKAYAEKYPETRQLTDAALAEGMSVDAYRAKLTDSLLTQPLPTAEIGMSRQETKRYSLMRAINALANPKDAAAQRAAAFELECSEAAAEAAGKQARGLIVPFDVLQRDLNVGTASAGGNLVATDLLSGNFIDLLRNAMVLPGLGAQMLTGLVGSVAIPKQSGAGTAYWVAESGAVTESQQTIAQVAMAPKTVGALTDISRKLLKQSSVDVEAMVQRDFANILGLAIQSVAINGGGTNEPTGILQTAGIGDVAGGTNGLAPTWAHIVELETDVSVANADVGSLAYLTNAKVRGKLKNTEQFSSTNGMPVWQNGSTPLNGYRGAVTNAVPSNLTKGTASGICSAIIFGNFADLLIGMWGGLDLLVDPYTGGASGTVRLIVHQDVDVAVRHAESFSAMQDALTT